MLNRPRLFSQRYLDSIGSASRMANISSIAPTGGEYRMGTGELVMTMSEDLPAGTFTWSGGSGSYSCPRLLTGEEYLVGP